MHMYKKSAPTRTSIYLNQSIEGETIEAKVRRIVNNNEPIVDGAPLIYTDRKDGTAPQYDIRTDRWEIAVEAMDKVAKAQAAKREGMRVEKGAGEGNGGAEPLRASGTEGGPNV